MKNLPTTGVLSDEKKTSDGDKAAVIGSPKYIPMLYSTEMVLAILSDDKSQTRRVLKNQPPLNAKFCGVIENTAGEIGYYFTDGTTGNMQGFFPGLDSNIKCPYGKPGDVIWVRETFFDCRKYKTAPAFNGANDFLYKADDAFIGCHNWKPSIHMPKEAARIFLEVIDVRLQLLNEISGVDAFREGVLIAPCYVPIGMSWNESRGAESQKKFKELWIKIYGNDSWSANPWVWVIEFNRIDRPTGFL
jgi:hypothetical protein